MNIAKYLKKLKPGIKLYSPVCGVCEFNNVDKDRDFPINVTTEKEGVFWFSAEGQYDSLQGECLLFPSKDCRDWEEWLKMICKNVLDKQADKTKVKKTTKAKTKKEAIKKTVKKEAIKEEPKKSKRSKKTKE